MAESFHSFHAAGAVLAEQVLGLSFTWGAVTFSAVIAPAAVEEGETEAIGTINAVLLKARKDQFSNSLYPQTNAILSGGGKRYRVVNAVSDRRNDPFIEIPAVEIPA